MSDGAFKGEPNVDGHAKPEGEDGLATEEEEVEDAAEIDDDEKDSEEAADDPLEEVEKEELEAAASPEAAADKDTDGPARQETEGKNEQEQPSFEGVGTAEAEHIDAPEDAKDLNDWDDEDEDEDSPFGIHPGADASSSLSSDLGDWALLLAYWVGEEDAVRTAVTDFGGHDEKFSIVLFDELISDREEGTLKEAWKCFKLLTAFAKRLAVKPAEGLNSLHIDTL